MEELTGGIVIGDGLSVLPGGVILGLRDLAAQSVGHQLAAIADAKDGYAPSEDLRIYVGGSIQIDGVRTAGEDNADGVHCPQLPEGRGIGLDLAVNTALPHPAGDELVVLTAEIQDDHSLMGHSDSFFAVDFTILLQISPCFL